MEIVKRNFYCDACGKECEEKEMYTMAIYASDYKNKREHIGVWEHNSFDICKVCYMESGFTKYLSRPPKSFMDMIKRIFARGFKEEKRMEGFEI